MANLPHFHSKNPLVLDEEEEKIITSFDSRIIAIKGERTLYLRKIAREKGITASSLEELKHENGELFEEKEKEERGMYRKAVSLNTSLEKALHISPFLCIAETAYLCHSMYSDDEDSCGWVKGDPIEEKYNNIGPLSGSAGVRFHCRICGKVIGDRKIAFS